MSQSPFENLKLKRYNGIEVDPDGAYVLYIAAQAVIDRLEVEVVAGLDEALKDAADWKAQFDLVKENGLYCWKQKYEQAEANLREYGRHAEGCSGAFGYRCRCGWDKVAKAEFEQDAWKGRFEATAREAERQGVACEQSESQVERLMALLKRCHVDLCRALAMPAHDDTPLLVGMLTDIGQALEEK